MSVQPRLIDAPLAGLYPITLTEANRFMRDWHHQLGICERPFSSMCHVLEVDGRPVAATIAASTVSEHVRDQLGIIWHRDHLVELARLVACEPWASRIMLRLWREVCAPLWPDWTPHAAVSYHHQGLHNGNLYRFDGWERWQVNAGSMGGGAWSRQRYATDVVAGPKTLWGWRFLKIESSSTVHHSTGR